MQVWRSIALGVLDPARQHSVTKLRSMSLCTFELRMEKRPDRTLINDMSSKSRLQLFARRFVRPWTMPYNVQMFVFHRFPSMPTIRWYTYHLTGEHAYMCRSNILDSLPFSHAFRSLTVPWRIAQWLGFSRRVVDQTMKHAPPRRWSTEFQARRFATPI